MNYRIINLFFRRALSDHRPAGRAPSGDHPGSADGTERRIRVSSRIQTERLEFHHLPVQRWVTEKLASVTTSSGLSGNSSEKN